MTVSLMNHFPISTLVLRILQPSHVPGGVFLKLLPPVCPRTLLTSVQVIPGGAPSLRMTVKSMV